MGDARPGRRGLGDALGGIVVLPGLLAGLGPFLGMFLARISRGRTLREFVIAAITAPVLCDFFIVSIFGNSALKVVMDGNTGFAERAMAEPEHGW